MTRRNWLKAWSFLLALGVLTPMRALAAVWNKSAFESQDVESALKGLGTRDINASQDIVLIAPDMAENGAIIQIEVISNIPNTEAIALIAEKNPTPLIANFLFSNGTLPVIITRIKMAESAYLKAIVKANGQYYSISREVNVALGGCG